MKKCTKCGEVLPLHMFCKNKATKDKLNTLCKECVRKNNKAYYENNQEEINEKNKTYYKKNKEELKKWYKTYYKKNKEEIKEKNKTYYKKNKEEINEYKKAYRDKNKEKASEYRRERFLKLPDSYIRQLLNNQGIDKSLITPEIMELKRATIKVTRIIKQKESKNI